MECEDDLCAFDEGQSNLTSPYNFSYGYNDTNNTVEYQSGPIFWKIVFNTFYGIICLVGIIGNGLVIYIVARYTKMKTVTNMYILNLAVADLCFLIGLPFLIVTTISEQWLFGFVMCKIFYILTSINWFTSVFTLTVMSADRYLAVCHPVRSLHFRTPLYSRIICICVWTASILVMLPILLYTRTDTYEGHVSCTLQWPEGQAISPDKAFIWYALLLGFAIPVALIVVFYTLVVLRLQSVGPKRKSKEKKRSHRKVTKMVLTVITVYIICWLPYWVFQVTLTFANNMPSWAKLAFQFITVLSYTNSMLNPVLYAFLSANFRKSFAKAFRCAALHEVNGALNNEQSTCPGGKCRTTTTSVVQQKLTRVPSEDAEEIEIASQNKPAKVVEATTMTVLSTQVNSSDSYVITLAKSDNNTSQSAASTV